MAINDFLVRLFLAFSSKHLVVMHNIDFIFWLVWVCEVKEVFCCGRQFKHKVIIKVNKIPGQARYLMQVRFNGIRIETRQVGLLLKDGIVTDQFKSRVVYFQPGRDLSVGD